MNTSSFAYWLMDNSKEILTAFGAGLKRIKTGKKTCSEELAHLYTAQKHISG
jgi:hypothetical protein